MPFEKDVFISYAHLDNQVLPLTEDGWVSVFEDCLRVFLSEYLGRTIEVWRDPRLESNTIFGDEILDSLHKSAVLVAVLSPRYIQSEWCIKELTQFWSSSQSAKLSCLGNASRIFKAEKIPVEDYPEELAFLENQISCTFFERDYSKDDIREIRIEFDKQQFFLRVSDLAKDITKLLKVFDENPHDVSPGESLAAKPSPNEATLNDNRSLLSAPKTSPKTSPEAAPADFPLEKTVYLATTTADLKATRDNIRRELETRGYLVLPQHPLPLELDAFAQQVRQDLKRSRLSIHLMGQAYGTVPEGSTHSTIALQNLLAIERNESVAFSRLIWLPPRLTNIKDERQQKLIGHLQRDVEAQRSADILQISLEELKTVILGKLQQPTAQPTSPPNLGTRPPAIISSPVSSPVASPVASPTVVPVSPSGSPSISSEAQSASTPPQAALRNTTFTGSVYLDFDRQDLSNPQTHAELKQIFETLKQHCQHVYMPNQDQAIVSFVDETLKQSDGILIYHGLGDKNWLEGRWKAATKAMGYTQSGRTKVRSIYIGTPATPLKASLVKQSQQGTQQAVPVIQGHGTFAPELLQPFLSQLNNSSQLNNGQEGNG